MAILWADSFEHDTTTTSFARRYPYLPTSSGGDLFRAPGGNLGGLFLAGTNTGGSALSFETPDLKAPLASSELAIGFALSTTFAKDDDVLVAIRGGHVDVFQVKIHTVGATHYRLAFLNAVDQQLLMLSDKIPVSVWSHVQIYLKLHDVTGEIKLAVNGLPVHLTGIKTATNGSNIYWTSVRFTLEGGSIGHIVGIDDLWITDGEFLGHDITIEPIYPFNLDLGPNEWTPTPAGGHWSTVADALTGTFDDDTTKLEDAGIGSTDLFGIIPLSRIKSEILAVMFSADAKVSSGSESLEFVSKDLSAEVPVIEEHATISVDSAGYKRYFALAPGVLSGGNLPGWVPERIDNWAFGVRRA